MLHSITMVVHAAIVGKIFFTFIFVKLAYIFALYITFA